MKSTRRLSGINSTGKIGGIRCRLSAASFRTMANSGGIDSDRRRRLFVMRHGERVDFTFGDWIPRCFDQNGCYIRTDLNMPVTVPQRKGGPREFFKDCPLTNIGCYQATLTGEALKEAGVVFSSVFCSPSLRCIQTCTNVLKASYQEHLPIHVEPGLFEWLMWYRDGMPDWFSDKELRSQGYNIATGYKPIVPRETLTKTTENLEEYYMRSYVLTKELLRQFSDGCLFFVAHAASLDTCTRQLVGQAPRDKNKFDHILYRTSYASIVTAEERSSGDWHIVPPLLPSGSVMHSNNSAFHWELLN